MELHLPAGVGEPLERAAVGHETIDLGLVRHGHDTPARVNDDREPTDTELDELIVFEAAMWRSVTRGDYSWMEQHLARNFTEFDRSGRRYTRAEVLAVEVGEKHATLPLRELHCRRLGGVAARRLFAELAAGLRCGVRCGADMDPVLARHP
ncbi:MAG TPA: hypothetical protein VFZ70_01465 [Euzebyales bacterium]